MNGLRVNLRTAATFGSLACALVAPGSALGQSVVDTRMERDTVSARSRPGFEAIGIAFGGFKLQPAFGLEGAATDNLYARRDVKVGDSSVSVKPSLSLQSQWSRHAVNLSASAAVDRFATHSSENTERYEVAGDGRLDLGTRSRITANASWARRIEPRGTSGDTLFGAKPIAYTLLSTGLGLEHDFGRTRLSLDGSYERYSYADRRLGATTIDLSDRNFEVVSGSARVAQAVTPGIAVFLDGSLSHSRYPVKLNGLDRDSTGYGALGGVLFGLSRLLQGEVGAGYLRQDFKDPIFPDINGLNYHVQLRWNPSRLTEVRLFAAKSFQRSPIANIAGVEQQDFSVSVEHELLRNLILRPGASYTTARYRGSARRDHYANAHFTAAWLIGPHFEVDATLAHGLGRNNVPAASAREYNQNRATIGLTWRM